MDLRAQLQQSLGDSYAVERELSGGGMSRVFVAVDRELDRQIVIKVLAPEQAATISAERFRREIAVAAKLQHPHIVPVLTAHAADDLAFYTMPLVEGESLRERLKATGELPVSDTLHILRDVALALSYAHAHGVVHRDIKPENILLNGHEAVVVDFGIAKARATSSDANTPALTSAGMAVGTAAYMAPEQAAGDPETDHRADLYALGVVAYEMLAGQPPFASRNTSALMAMHATHTAPPIEGVRANVPEALATLVSQLLEKRPADRLQHADAVLGVLESIPAGGSGTARRTAAGPVRRRPLVRVAAAAGALLIVGAALIAMVRRQRAPDAQTGALAVMPFVTIGGDSSDVYFAEGMSEELIAALGHVGLTVSGRNSAFRLGRRKATAREVGEALHVNMIVQGTVQRADGKIRITATLIRTSDEATLWSKKYVHPAGEIFKLQDEVASAIAGELNVGLADPDGGRHEERGTRSQVAYEHYLQARALWAKRGGPSLLKASELFGEAIKLDSMFARAWAGRALVHVVLPDYAPVRPDSTLPLALADAEKALALSPNDPDATLAMAHANAFRWEWQAAAGGYQKVLTWNPSNVTAHLWFGMMLRASGRIDEAVAELRKAVSLDPLSQVAGWNLALGLIVARQFDEAVVVSRRNVSLDTMNIYANNNAGYAFLWGASASPDSAARYYATTIRLDPRAIVPRRGLIFLDALSGKTAEARRKVTALRGALDPSLIENTDQLSSIYGLTGDLDSAFASLERGLATKDQGLVETAGVCAPEFDPMRADARWAAAMRRMNITRCDYKNPSP